MKTYTLSLLVFLAITSVLSELDIKNDDNVDFIDLGDTDDDVNLVSPKDNEGNYPSKDRYEEKSVVHSNTHNVHADAHQSIITSRKVLNNSHYFFEHVHNQDSSENGKPRQRHGKKSRSHKRHGSRRVHGSRHLKNNDDRKKGKDEDMYYTY